jgi:hypothetical protein
MNTFTVLAAITLCVSFVVLRASFDDLREAPLQLDRSAVPMRKVGVHKPMPAGASWTPSTISEANEGLLDHELAGDDPIQAWLDRYLAPPAK